MEKYFELPQLGDLFIEHVFYELDDEPILFVCQDTLGMRYLCSCCLMYTEWVVANVSESTLLSLIEDKVSIREVFESSDTLFFVTWNGAAFTIDGDVPVDAYPLKGAKLELESEKTGPFGEMLKQKVKEKKSLQQAVKTHQMLLPVFKKLHQSATLQLKESQAILSAWTEHQKAYGSLMKEYQALAPALEKLSQVISASIPTYLFYQNSEYWNMFYQCLNSFPAVIHQKDETEEVEQIISVEHLSQTTSKTHNQISNDDEIQYLAA